MTKTPTLVHGTVDRYGEVVIHWNLQATTLRSPSGGIYFPCGSCGVVHDIPYNVVAFTCDPCMMHRDTCDDIDCEHPVHGRRGDYHAMTGYDRTERNIDIWDR